MNESEPQIEIFKPFGEAFGLMKRILFQPFDLNKWCVIGFAAFLASLAGGAHFNFTGFNRKHDWRWSISSARHNIIPTGGHLPGWVIPLAIVFVLFVIALVVVLLWLGARGRFMFVDCIVRNRGAIKEPWREFRKEGNSFFGLSILVILLLLIVAAIGALPFFLPVILHGNAAPYRTALIAGMISLVTLLVLLAFAWNLISQLIVPVMYRKRCRAVVAFRDVIDLILNHPAPLILYFLFFIVLAIASVIVGCLVACLTCCIAAIPYVGTVILLPLHVLVAGFTLFFLRQFGVEYDVWAGVAPTAPVPPLPPMAPPPVQT